jgi:hypothetical protein
MKMEILFRTNKLLFCRYLTGSYIYHGYLHGLGEFKLTGAQK